MPYNYKHFCYSTKFRTVAKIVAILCGFIGTALLTVGIILSIISENLFVASVVMIIFGSLLLFYFLIYIVCPNFGEWFAVDDNAITYCNGKHKTKTFEWSDVKNCTLLGDKTPDVILIQIDNKVWEYNFRRFGYGRDENTIVLPYKKEIFKKISQYKTIDNPHDLPLEK